MPIELDATDARALLNKWRTENSRLRLVFVYPFNSGELHCVIAEIQWPTLKCIGQDLRSLFIANLTNVTFRYADSRESSPERRQLVSNNASVLIAEFTCDTRISFYEVGE